MRWIVSGELDEDNSACIEFCVADLLGFSFIGTHKPDAKIQFYGPFGEHVSMGNVSIEICRYLVKRLDHVAIHNYIPAPWIDKELESYSGLNSKADIGIILGTPDIVPEFFYDHDISIGGFVCETDAINPQWVAVCNKLDLVFVPTKWCQSAFLNSGVTSPIYVLPHGIEEDYKPVDGLLDTEDFVFYNTFHSGSFCSRKSMEELIRAFLNTFSSGDNAVLRLRTDESSKLKECKRKYNFGTKIQHEPLEHCSTEDFASIYSQVHCTVHPSKGEGFGLIPFQSIACETPVIAPHKTGMADYLRDDNSVMVETNGRVKGEGVGNSHGTYFSIDEQDLQKKLRYMYENWQYEKDKLKASAPLFREKHSWPNVLSGFFNLLELLLSVNQDDRIAILARYKVK
ncbi:MAG: glycosyltransferase involved in cell wall biosynthesis [Arenicella sp.]|jgi:glycosyltransferase involved in cell wall biosynthesis